MLKLIEAARLDGIKLRPLSYDLARYMLFADLVSSPFLTFVDPVF